MRSGQAVVSRKREFIAAAPLILVLAMASGSMAWWDRRGPHPATAIFEGITYGCERLDTTEEGGGLLHWVRIELTAPGIELYVTPLNPSAAARGWQYRLRHI